MTGGLGCTCDGNTIWRSSAEFLISVFLRLLLVFLFMFCRVFLSGGRERLCPPAAIWLHFAPGILKLKGVVPKGKKGKERSKCSEDERAEESKMY